MSELQQLIDRTKAALEKTASSTWYKTESGICGPAGTTYRVSPQFTDAGGMSKESAEFIVQAHNDMPKLLAVIERALKDLQCAGGTVCLPDDPCYDCGVRADLDCIASQGEE